MSAPNKSSTPRRSSCNSLSARPLTELNQNICNNERENGKGSKNSVPLAVHISQTKINSTDKENAAPNKIQKDLPSWDKENSAVGEGKHIEAKNAGSVGGFFLKDRALKPSSLQFCMQKSELDPKKIWEPTDSETTNSGNIWCYSDSEAAPASSWSTLPNRSLLFRPLPIDVGRCNCVIVKEAAPQGLNGGTLYSLYTQEGQGRQNRKLAVAHYRRRGGRWKFTIASNIKELLSSSSDDSLIGVITSNFMGSKYHIWDQGGQVKSLGKQPKLLAVVSFMTTIATWTGSYRSLKAWVPKHQSMQLKNAASQHSGGLPVDWEERMDKAHQLISRVPQYNKISKQYELDFRDRGQTGLRVQSSVKNFQLTLEKNGRQTILQLGRVGKSMYVMDYRYPLTGFQAFCICLAAIDSKPCCAV